MMKIRNRIMAGILATALTVGLFGVPGMGEGHKAEAAELPVRETTTDTAASGTILVGVEGVECTSSMQDILKQINDVRWEACTDGNVPDPRDTSRMLTEEDYHAVQFGAALQQSAVIRAAEGAVRLAHTRPDGTSCFTVGQYFGATGAEDLAWNSAVGTSMGGWIGEKADWVAQTAGAVTGHYTSMIDPDYRYVGIASFNPTNDNAPYDWTCTSGEFGTRDTALTDLADAQNTLVIQKMPVLISAVQDMNIHSDSFLHVGDRVDAELLVDFYFTGARENTTRDCPVYDGVSWSSSDTDVISVTSKGVIYAKATGSAEITATIGSGTSAKDVTRKILVVPAGVTVTGVADPDMVYTDSYKTPVLSKTVKATLSDDSTVDVDVVWDTYSTSNLATYFTSREFDIAGKALGFDVTQRVHVNAAQIKKVYTSVEELTTDSGTKPATVETWVDLSNNYTYKFPSGWASTYYTVWDQDSLNQYKLRAGGDFVITGVFKVTTDNGVEEFDVKQKMHVNPATVTDVVFTVTEVTTDSGTEPVYPKTSVTWSNGDETEEDIAWTGAEPTTTDRKYMAREGGDYTLTGTYNGEETSITVHVNPAVPVTATIPVAETAKTVPSGTAATLTETASITWSNGDVTTAAITWDEQSHDDYGKIDGGSYTVKGIAEGLAVSVKVTVLPARIQSVETLSGIETVQKKAPVLPETVHVVWTNGDETDEKVSWETVAASSYATPNTDFIVTGTISDFEGTKTEVTIAVHVNERELVSIAWKGDGPTGATSYYIYQKKDLTGVLIATYDNEDEEEVILTSDMITGFDADSRKSAQIVTVTYTDAGVSKTVTAEMHLIQRIGIRIDTAPTKTAYIEGETLDPEGIAISELLDNDTERVISEEELETTVYTGYDLNPAEYGAETVTVSLGDYSDTYDITVRKKRLSSIRIVSLPKQLTFVTTQPLDMTGLVVKAGYDNGSEKQITVTADMLRENLTEEGLSQKDFGIDANTDTAGDHRIYVLYSEQIETDDGRTGTQYTAAYFDVTVLEKEVQSIEFAKAPGVTEYPEDDVAYSSFSDAILLAHNNNDYDEKVPITEAEITGFDISKIGTQEVTVTYGGKTMTFDAVVRAKTVTKTYVVAPTRVSYTEEEYLDLSGAEVVIEYDNGREDRIPLTEENGDLTIAFDDGFDLTAPLTEAERKLMVTWKGEEVLTADGEEITIDTIHKILQKIEWKKGSPTGNTSYYAYDKADLTGTLLASYDNGDVEEVEVTPEMITAFDADSQKSTQTVTITYSYAGVSVTMNTEMKLVKRIGIRIGQTPTKTEYIEGEALDTAGLMIEELLDNGEVRPLSETETETAVYTGFISRPASYGEQTITVTVGDFSDTYTVKVRKKMLAGIQLISAPAQLLYVETQPLSLAGLQVQAVYDNGDKDAIAVTKDMLREGVTETGLQSGNTGTAADTVGVGPHTVTVLYSEEAEGAILYAWVSFDVEVIEKVVQSIEFVTEPSKTEYPEGDVNFDNFGGIRIIAHCNNDYDEIVEITADEISGFDLDAVGEQTVTATYGGQEITFPAKVREKTATATVVTPPTKTSYEPGEALDMTGARIIITYDNGTTEEIPVTEENEDIQVTLVGGSDTEGSKRLVITYKGEKLEMEDGAPVTVKVEKKRVKTSYRSEWRKNVWYDKNGYATDLTMKWKHNKKGWWIVDSQGRYPVRKWQKIDGKWYFFRPDGYMASNEWWQGWWMNKNGTCTYTGKASWHHNKTGWWYEDNKGWYARSSWQKIDGKWYYFDSRGYMVTSRYVDGYWIGADGVCR